MKYSGSPELPPFGTVSSNPLDILLGVFILAAGLNAGRIGLALGDSIHS
jgi:hypothetical protein